MREHKFRAWDLQQKQMIYFDLTNIYGYEGEECGIVLPDGYTMLNYNSGYGINGFNKNLIIMDYTGFKDDNNKEIYMGDIIEWYARTAMEKYHKTQPRERLNQISFADGQYVILSNEKSNLNAGRYWPLNTYYNISFPGGTYKKIEAIGNIYENDNLLREYLNG